LEESPWRWHPAWHLEPALQRRCKALTPHWTMAFTDVAVCVDASAPGEFAWEWTVLHLCSQGRKCNVRVVSVAIAEDFMDSAEPDAPWLVSSDSAVRREAEARAIADAVKQCVLPRRVRVALIGSADLADERRSAMTPPCLIFCAECKRCCSESRRPRRRHSPSRRPWSPGPWARPSS
jgi:hypothetical protein